MSTLEQRLWSRVVKSAGCWLWTGARGGGHAAYGQVLRDGKKCSAHRVAYELQYGPAPDGFVGCHHGHLDRALGPRLRRHIRRTVEPPVDPPRLDRAVRRWIADRRLPGGAR